MMLVKGLSHSEHWINAKDHLDTGTVGGRDTVECLKVEAWKPPSQALPLTNCDTLHKLLNLSVPQFPHL